jgi:hypothetical protein
MLNFDSKDANLNFGYLIVDCVHPYALHYAYSHLFRGYCI